MAKLILGLVVTDVYIRLPMATLYGIFFIHNTSVGLEGQSLQEYATPGTMGVAKGFASARANWVRIESI